MAEEGDSQQDQGAAPSDTRQGQRNGNAPTARWDELFAGMTPDEVKKALEESRKWEKRTKDNKTKADQFDELEAANHTETERANARAAAAEAKATAAAEKIAAARLEAALTGVVDQPADVVADLNIGKFLTDDGDVDADKVAALKAKYAGFAPTRDPRAPAVNPAQGAGGKAPTLGDLVKEAEKSGDPRKSIRAKSAQLLQLRNQG
jgi:hypothetical protein